MDSPGAMDLRQKRMGSLRRLRGTSVSMQAELRSPTRSPADGAGFATQEVGGWPGPAADAGRGPEDLRVLDRKPKSKKQVVPERVTTGPVGALEFDKKYQKELLRQWKRELESEDTEALVARQQLCLFFDFLKDSDGADKNLHLSKYISEAIGDIDMEAELRKSLPDNHFGKALDFKPQQIKAIRTVLSLYAQVSRPSCGGLGEVIFRPTFCRFLVDSCLVAFDSKSAGWPRYHNSVRMFDGVSRTAAFGFVGQPGGGLKMATFDQCVGIIGDLLVQVEMPAQAAWVIFEKGLERAQRIAKALLEENARLTKLRVEESEAEFTDEAIMERRMEMFGKHGSPPQSYNGPIRLWSRGLRFWADLVNAQCTPEATALRVEQTLVLKTFVRDMLIEPGVIHVCLKFGGLFKELYDAYSDEERARYIESDDGSVKMEKVPHMNFAIFFRFLLDFGAVPRLCSFEEAWAAYCGSESVQRLGSADAPVKETVERTAVKQKKSKKDRKHKSERRVSNDSTTLDIGKSLVPAGDEWDDQASTGGKSQTRSDSEESSSSSDDDESSADSDGQESKGSKRRKAEDAAKAAQAAQAKAQTHPPVRRASQGHVRRPSILGVAAHPPHEAPHPVPGRRTSNASMVPDVLAAAAAAAAGKGQGRKASVQLQSSDIDTLQAVTLGRRKGSTTSIEAISQQAHNAMRASTSHRKSMTGGEISVDDLAQIIQAHSSHHQNHPSMAGSHPPQLAHLMPRRAGGSHHDSNQHSGKETPPPLEHGHEHGKKAEDEVEEQEPPPRIKVTTDLSWMHKDLSEMSEKETNAFALLCALVDCTFDRFLNVRGLFESVGEKTNRAGDLDVMQVRRALAKLRVTHSFGNDDELKDFLLLVDAHNKGMLDPGQLEKAVACARDDMHRRWPTKSNERGERGTIAALLGEEARRLSQERKPEPSQDGEKVDTAEENTTAFGHAAFTETLLYLGIGHMQGCGVPVKTAAPTEVKSLWMIAFLHAGFEEQVLNRKDELLMDQKLAAEAATRQVEDDTQRQRSERDGRPNKSPPKLMNALHSPPGMSGSSRWSPVVKMTTMLGSQLQSRATPASPADGASRPDDAAAQPAATMTVKPWDRKHSPGPQVRRGSGVLDSMLMRRIPPKPSTEEQRPPGSKYTPNLHVLLENQDLFSRWLDGDGSGLEQWGGRRKAFLPSSVCQSCRRKGGSVFCHVCSGVDDQPLSETLLCPAFEHQLLRMQLSGLKFLDGDVPKKKVVQPEAKVLQIQDNKVESSHHASNHHGSIAPGTHTHLPHMAH